MSGPVLLLLCVLRLSQQTCPSVCLCVSDAVSCSGGALTRLPRALPASPLSLDLSHNQLTRLGVGSFSRLPRLETLLLSHNQLGSLGAGVFLNASRLRLLDLSSNRLQALQQQDLQGLWRLEELLLFNNRISQVGGGALSGLGALKKLYLSLNQLTHFPFFSIRDRTHPFLSMLDLSSNRLSRLPWEEVRVLPGLVQRGLYLHNNTLLCECPLFSVFWFWSLRDFVPLKDFVDQLTCSVSGDPRAAVRFLRHQRLFQNCSVETPVSAPVTVLLSQVRVAEGEGLLLDCVTSLGAAAVSFRWQSPGRGAVTPATNQSLVRLHGNGTLEVGVARLGDSGLYVCTALDVTGSLNATRRVNVTVLPPPPGPAFSTGWTTLLGCVATAAAVLLYLYLTPCRCSKQPRPPAVPTATGEPSSIASIFSPSRDKVTFMEAKTSEDETEDS